MSPLGAELFRRYSGFERWYRNLKIERIEANFFSNAALYHIGFGKVSAVPDTVVFTGLILYNLI